MSSVAISYTYRYPFESTVLQSSDCPSIRLATSLDGCSEDLFFAGNIKQPALVGKCLATLSTIVRTRFFQPFDPIVLDPVVTSGGGLLRFEGFSSCCGVYARVDLTPEAFDTELRGKGTTNVDFGDAMRTALKRMGEHDSAQLEVGGAGVTLRTPDDRVVERKVKLPKRWIKGFCEVQAYQPRMIPFFQLTRTEALNLFRSFPSGSNAKRPVFITKTGQAYRLASREQSGSVKVEGIERVRVLEPLLPFVDRIIIWYNQDAETSGWELQFPVGRMFTLVSPELSRGFSGEGQMLSRLAATDWQRSIEAVAESLQWQSRIETARVSQQTGHAEADVESALAMLGARGLVGFDMHSGHYFHRVLPFDLDSVEREQPRLVDARELVANNKVKVVETMPASTNALVSGTDVEHFVRLRSGGDRCTCQWFNRYQGRRGPCKHILAARIAVDGESSELLRSVSEETQ